MSTKGEENSISTNQCAHNFAGSSSDNPLVTNSFSASPRRLRIRQLFLPRCRNEPGQSGAEEKEKLLIINGITLGLSHRICSMIGAPRSATCPVTPRTDCQLIAA